jgi:hypothetical protein
LFRTSRGMGAAPLFSIEKGGIVVAIAVQRGDHRVP